MRKFDIMRRPNSLTFFKKPRCAVLALVCAPMRCAVQTRDPCFLREKGDEKREDCKSLRDAHEETSDIRHKLGQDSVR